MKPASKSITALFNKFVGKQLKDPMRMTCDLDDVYEALQKTANDNGLALRVKFPGMMGTSDYNANRVNISVKKNKAGRFIITKPFDMG